MYMCACMCLIQRMQTIYTEAKNRIWFQFAQNMLAQHVWLEMFLSALTR